MATADDIAAIRLMIAEPDNVEPYTDAALGVRIDVASTLQDVAFDVWGEKAAAAAQLVDISEGGSSRKNSDLLAQALRMREVYGAAAASAIGTGGTRVARLRRTVQ